MALYRKPILKYNCQGDPAVCVPPATFLSPADHAARCSRWELGSQITDGTMAAGQDSWEHVRIPRERPEKTDQVEKEAVLKALVDHIVPGRSAEVRGPSRRELKATQVLAIPLEESSAKVRTGPPKDAFADYALPIWAGELPLRLQALAPVADPQLSTGIPVPEHVQTYGQHNLDRSA